MVYKFNEKVPVKALADLRESVGWNRMEREYKNPLMTSYYHIAVYENEKLRNLLVTDPLPPCFNAAGDFAIISRQQICWRVLLCTPVDEYPRRARFRHIGNTKGNWEFPTRGKGFFARRMAKNIKSFF